MRTYFVSYSSKKGFGCCEMDIKKDFAIKVVTNEIEKIYCCFVQS